MDLFYLFLSQFFSVQVMILSSKLIQNNRIYLAAINSWLITLTQCTFVYIVSNSVFSNTEKVLSAGLGGSLGVLAGYFLYQRFIHKDDK